MPSNDELYLEWLKSSKSSQIHILQVESGANTTAERLSFSSKQFHGVYPDSVGESGGWEILRVKTPGELIQGGTIAGFTPDGLTCYEDDNEYQLLRPWDPSTKKLIRTGLFGYKALSGSKLYRLVGTGISEYDLLTPWDTSTNSFVSTKSLLGNLTGIDAISVTENGQYVYTLGSTAAGATAIEKFEFGTPGVVSTLSSQGVKDFGVGVLNSRKAIMASPDSTVIWILARNIDHSLIQYHFDVPGDITSLVGTGTFNVRNLATGASSIATNPAGTILYLGTVNGANNNMLLNVGNVAPVVQNVLMPGISFKQDLNSLSFSDFSIENDGRFDGLFQDCDIRGHEFRLLFGDSSWDLGETGEPYRFIEIARGVIDDVVHQSANLIRLKALPKKINLLSVIGGEETPVAYGKCINIPVPLIDSLTDHYRANTVYTDQPMALRDNGVTLTPGSGNDYELTLVGGEFFGDITTDGAAHGELTADVNTASVRAIGLKKVAEDILRDSLELPNIDSFGVKYTGFSSQDSQPLDFKTNQAGTLAYMLGGATNTIYEYSIASAYDITLLVYTGNSFAFDSQDDSAVGFDIWDNTLIMAGAENNAIYRYTLGADISALTYASDSRVISEDDDIQGVAIDEFDYFGVNEFNRILVLGNQKKSIQTYGNVGGFSCSSSTHYGSDEGVAVPDDSPVNISNNDLNEVGASIAYVVGRDTSKVFQYSLPTNFTALEEETARYEGKSFFIGDEDSMPSAVSLSADGDLMFMVGVTDGDAHEYNLSFNYELPSDLLRTNIPGGNRDFECGTWIGRERQLGSVVKDLLKSLSCSFSVNRSGGLSAIRLQDPNTESPLTDDIVEISEGDLVYQDYSTRIVHVKSDPTIKNISLLYSKNHTVQNRGSLGDISEDLKKLYSTEFKKLTKSNSLFNCPDKTDIVLETLLTDESECQDELDRVAELRSVVRDYLSFTVDADILPVNNTYGVGNIVLLNLSHPLITYGQKALIVGYERDDQIRKVKLTVYK